LKYYLKAGDQITSEHAQVTSPCFDNKLNKKASASLKERIALNQRIVRSPKTGGLKGVHPRRLVTATYRGPMTAR
jgi:hypothetical protein